MIACPEWAKPLFVFAKCDVHPTPSTLNGSFAAQLRVGRGALRQGERRVRNDQVVNLPKKMVYRSAEQPRCRRHDPLDRWLCVPTFRRVCPVQREGLCGTGGPGVKGARKSRGNGGFCAGRLRESQRQYGKGDGARASPSAGLPRRAPAPRVCRTGSARRPRAAPCPDPVRAP